MLVGNVELPAEAKLPVVVDAEADDAGVVQGIEGRDEMPFLLAADRAPGRMELQEDDLSFLKGSLVGRRGVVLIGGGRAGQDIPRDGLSAPAAPGKEEEDEKP